MILTTDWLDEATAEHGVPLPERLGDGGTETLRVLSPAEIRPLWSPTPTAG